MKTYELVIFTLFCSSKGMIAGRTLLQKTLYFLNEKLELGLDFIPYYYGPYSTEIAEVTSSLKASGIVEEIVEKFLPFNFNVAFEPRRYVYQLTEIGKKIACLIKNRNSEKTKRIKQVIEVMKKFGESHDYKNLSIAAKMDHILKVEGKPMTIEQIMKEASAIDWKIEKKEAGEAIDFLEKTKLIKVSK